MFETLPRSSRPLKTLRFTLPSVLCLGLFSLAATAQQAAIETVSAVPAAPSTAAMLAQNEPVASLALPDAPGFSSSADAAPATVENTALAGGFGGQSRPVASKYSKTVYPGQTAPRLSVHDKVVLGIRENISPISAAGWLISAGYEQATNGSPNYGQTGKGFAQRLGAAAARGSSENIFQDSVLSAVLHEDPRYYVMGPGHNFFKRVIYAGTRPLIGKTDGGRTTINFADLGGDLAGSALTQAYYPPLNRGTTEVLKTFGGSVGGDALGFLAAEFLPSIFHLRRASN